MEFPSTFPHLHKINHTKLFPSYFICVFGSPTTTIHVFSKSRHDMDIFVCAANVRTYWAKKPTTHTISVVCTQ